jgi:hypothetical protein
MSVDKILKDRQLTHGDYATKCDTIQYMKHAMRSTDGFYELQSDQMESLELILTKIGRILHGNPNHIDSWLDIAGYSQLIINRLQSQNSKPNTTTHRPTKK